MKKDLLRTHDSGCRARPANENLQFMFRGMSLSTTETRIVSSKPACRWGVSIAAKLNLSQSRGKFFWLWGPTDIFRAGGCPSLYE